MALPLVVDVSRSNPEESLGLAIETTGLVKGIVDGGAMHKSLDPESLVKLKSGTYKLISINHEEIPLGSSGTVAALMRACKDQTEMVMVFLQAESPTEVAFVVHRDNPEMPLGVDVDPTTGKILKIDPMGAVGRGLDVAAGNSGVDNIRFAVQKYIVRAVEGTRIEWGKPGSDSALTDATEGLTDFVIVADEAPSHMHIDAKPTLPPPLHVTVVRDPPDQPLGLAMDAGTGKVKDVVAGGALHNSIDAATLEKLKSGTWRLHSVNCTEIALGRTTTLGELKKACQDQPELKVVFVAVSDPGEVAFAVHRDSPDMPLGVVVDPATGKILEMDADGVLGKALVLSCNASGGDADTILRQASQRYLIRAVEGTRIAWGKPGSDTALAAAAEGLTDFIVIMDEAPLLLCKFAPLPPLWERRPDLYRPCAISVSTIKSGCGIVRIVRDSKDGSILQEMRDEAPIRRTEIQSGGSRYVEMEYADGHIDRIELRSGVVRGNTCPYSFEELNQWDIDSCYGRFPLVQLEVFTVDFRETGIYPNRTRHQIFICKVCKLEKTMHVRDGSRPPRPEDSYIPRSHMSCALPTGFLQKYTKFPPPAPIFCKNRHPTTDELLCATCTFPIDGHPAGPDPADAAFEAAGVADLMYVLSGGRDGRPAEPGKESAKLKQYLVAQNVSKMFGGGNAGAAGAAGARAVVPPDWKPEDGARTVDTVALCGVNVDGYMSKYSIGKSGGLFKNWKKRYFTLRGGVLMYMEKPGTAPKGTIVLVNKQNTRLVTMCTAKTHPQSGGNPLDLLLIYVDLGAERRLLLRCDSQSDHTKWAEALCNAAWVVNKVSDVNP
jgi:hypothetical protein